MRVLAGAAPAVVGGVADIADVGAAGVVSALTKTLQIPKRKRKCNLTGR